jgi:hypothetical protein
VSRYRCPRCGSVSYNRNDATVRYCGGCHAYAADLLGFRLVVAGLVVDESWVDVTAGGVDKRIEDIRDRHSVRAMQAIEAGDEWALEILDPGTEHGVKLSSVAGPGSTPLDMYDGDTLGDVVARALGYLP